MKNLTRDGDVIKGDKIMTSGLGGIYPKGLLIGDVMDVLDDDGGLMKHAFVSFSCCTWLVGIYTRNNNYLIFYLFLNLRKT